MYAYKLAHFIIQNRWQAIAVVVLLSFAPMLSWLAAAALSLVTLRKGAYEGSIILLAGLAPMAYLTFSQEAINLLHVLDALMLLVVYFSSIILCYSTHLAWSLLSVTLLVGTAILLLGSQFTTWVMSFGEQLLQTLHIVEKNFPQNNINETTTIPQHMFSPFSLALQSISLRITLKAIAALFVGRWLQAILFNPGGFQQEFHQLRFPFAIAALLLGLALFDYQQWVAWPVESLSLFFLLPLIIVGSALAHWWIKQTNKSKYWLIGFYASLVFTHMFVAILAVVDSFLNIRTRYGPKT